MNHSPSKLKRALALLLSLLLLGSMSSTVLAADSVKVTGTYCQTDARKMLKGINAFRTGSEAWYWNKDNKTKTKCKDLNKLKYDYTLEKIAMLRAAEITVKWSHTRPDGTDCFTAFDGTSYTVMGENLAMGTKMTRDIALEGLKETDEDYAGQGHRRNMLYSKYTAVGIAHFQCDGCDYWVQEFGSPALDTNETKPNDSEATVKVSLTPSSNGSSKGSGKVNLTLKWHRDKNADGYQLQYSTSKKFKKKKTVKIKKNKTTSYTVKNQKAGKKYYMRLRSYKKSGKKTKYSKWSETVVFET